MSDMLRYTVLVQPGPPQDVGGAVVEMGGVVEKTGVIGVEVGGADVQLGGAAVELGGAAVELGGVSGGDIVELELLKYPSIALFAISL